MSRRMKRLGDALIPAATSTRVHICPDNHIHLIGLDEDGNPMCEIAIGRKLMMTIMDAFTDRYLSDDEESE